MKPRKIPDVPAPGAAAHLSHPGGLFFSWEFFYEGLPFFPGFEWLTALGRPFFRGLNG